MQRIGLGHELLHILDGGRRPRWRGGRQGLRRQPQDDAMHGGQRARPGLGNFGGRNAYFWKALRGDPGGNRADARRLHLVRRGDGRRRWNGRWLRGFRGLGFGGSRNGLRFWDGAGLFGLKENVRPIHAESLCASKTGWNERRCGEEARLCVELNRSAEPRPKQATLFTFSLPLSAPRRSAVAYNVLNFFCPASSAGPHVTLS